MLLLAGGAARTAAHFGHAELAMVTKGQAVPAYEPRGMKGMGLGYATSNRGACHLRAYVAAAELGDAWDGGLRSVLRDLEVLGQPGDLRL